MVITRDNIDDILIENGLIKEGFNKRQKIGQKWLDVYDTNLEKIFLVTSYIINNGRDKKSVALLLDCIKVATDIIALAPRGADPSDVVKQEKRVKALEKTEPTKLLTAGLRNAVKECLLDTVTVNNAIKFDLESSGVDRVKIIREVYIKDVGVGTSEHNFDPNSFMSEPLSALDEANGIFEHMMPIVDTILDDSSGKAYDLAFNIVENVCRWRDDAVYSYLNITNDTARPLSEAEYWLTKWNERAVGVDSKNNPRVSAADTERIRKLWIGDQASLYVAEARKRGAKI